MRATRGYLPAPRSRDAMRLREMDAVLLYRRCFLSGCLSATLIFSPVAADGINGLLPTEIENDERAARGYHIYVLHVNNTLFSLRDDFSTFFPFSPPPKNQRIVRKSFKNKIASVKYIHILIF